MNATRVVAQEAIYVPSQLLVFRLPELRILVLLFLVLLTAVTLIYLKDLNRRLFIDYQSKSLQTELLQTDNNRLLLEQSAWANQARVQLIAEQRLGMQIPATKDVVMIKV